MRRERISFRDETRNTRPKKSPWRQLLLWMALLALAFLLLYFLG